MPERKDGKIFRQTSWRGLRNIEGASGESIEERMRSGNQRTVGSPEGATGLVPSSNSNDSNSSSAGSSSQTSKPLTST